MFDGEHSSCFATWNPKTTQRHKYKMIIRKTKQHILSLNLSTHNTIRLSSANLGSRHSTCTHTLSMDVYCRLLQQKVSGTCRMCVECFLQIIAKIYYGYGTLRLSQEVVLYLAPPCVVTPVVTTPVVTRRRGLICVVLPVAGSGADEDHVDHDGSNDR